MIGLPRDKSPRPIRHRPLTTAGGNEEREPKDEQCAENRQEQTEQTAPDKPRRRSTDD